MSKWVAFALLPAFSVEMFELKSYNAECTWSDTIVVDGTHYQFETEQSKVASVKTDYSEETVAYAPLSSSVLGIPTIVRMHAPSLALTTA